MSVLLVDIGNTRIKWAKLVAARLTRQRAAVHAKWRTADFERHVLSTARGIERMLVVSVAGEALNERLARAARRTHGINPEFVASARTLGGVTTAYEEPWRLGVDRLVAVIGARHLTQGRPACVIDVGTAMTIDLVDAAGRHHGGAIVPGPDLMVRSLLTHTNGIRRRASGAPRGSNLFARNTREAIEQGARYAVAAVVDRSVEEARRVVGGRPIVFLTGGAAPEIQPLLGTAHRHVPDLVLHGLGVLAAPNGAR